jgi:hypothetical protein
VPQIGVGVPAGRPDRRQADFERLHKYLREIAYIDYISDEMRAVIESEWPELVCKLPPKKPRGRAL